MEEAKVLAGSILSGDEIGPKRDIVLINAAAALTVGGRVRDIKEGIGAAADSLDSGRARKKLEEVIEFGKA